MRNLLHRKMAFAASASILAATIASSASAQSAQNSASDGSTIVVTGQRQAYVGDLPVRDIPQNIQSISGNVLKDIGITRMDKALDLVSGVSHMNNYGGLWDAYSFRGFAGDANNVPSGFLVNGFAARGFAGPAILPASNAWTFSKVRPQLFLAVANLAVQ
jgi:iron complex outermembrane receptor protein